MSNLLEPEPLPDPTITLTSCSPDVREAYSRVFRAQTLASKAKDQAARNARIVGYLLIYLHQFKHTLGETPITYLEGQIRRLENDEEVFDLGEHYLQLFAAFRRYKPTPNPSTRPSRDHLESLVGSKRDHARAKHLALFRDGFLCLATSILEMDVSKYGISQAHDGRDVCSTQCCHILNFGAGKWNVTDCQENGRQAKSGGMLSILKAFGISMSDTLLEEDGVHDLRNILTLQTACHELFDALNMCFEPTEVKHQYKIHHFTTSYIAKLTHKIVTFKINDAIPGRVVKDSSSLRHDIEIMKGNPDLYLPDPQLLALHATCARVAHMSGAAEVLDDWVRDFDEKKVLATDGSDMDMFKYALMGLVQVEVN